MAKQIHAAGLLMENPSGELLVLLRNSNRPEPNVYGPPGGKIKFLEGKKNAIIRETYEETGLRLDPNKWR